MNHRKILPKDDTHLLDIVPSRALAPVDPENKAVIMHWMYFADLTAAGQIFNKTKSTINYAAPRIARQISLDILGIDVNDGSIEIYYLQAKKNAMGNGEPWAWDMGAVAKIIRSQVSDPATYDKVSHRLDCYEVTPADSPEASVVKLVRDTMRSVAGQKLRDCWAGLAPPGVTYVCNLDPKLEQSCNRESTSQNPDDLYQSDASYALVHIDRET